MPFIFIHSKFNLGMQANSPASTAGRQRLATLNDTPSYKQQQSQQTTRNNISQADSDQGYITEEYLSYLAGGPFNRYALALKSGLENEIDWACARLVSATYQAPDNWSLSHHAPFLLEAILGVLERSRTELIGARDSNHHRLSSTERTGQANRLRGDILSDNGLGMVTKRATERAGLVVTCLFNMAQVGGNAAFIAQDPRVTIEATQWLRQFSGDDAGYVAVKAELLDVLDILFPMTPQPPFEREPLEKWPAAFSSSKSARNSPLDPLVLVETCLWDPLLRIICESQERRLVIGAIRIMVQSVSWHPQLAREILELPVPRWANHICDNAFEFAGELINQRLSELVLAPDAELVAACFELMVNMVRLEAMANALDEELQTYALKNAASNVVVRRRKRLRNGLDTADSPSGGESGSQTPIFGLRSLYRSGSRGGVTSTSAIQESESSMLPDGLVTLVALVLQQWMSVACGPSPHESSQPLSDPASQYKNVNNKSKPISANDQQQTNGTDNNDRPPTEPELREACTWVLLNYEIFQTQHQPVYVTMNDLFGRYTIAKHGQTVPRIGRALNITEIMRVVAAVFPKASLQTIGQQRPGGDMDATQVVAVNIRPKSQSIVPIPAVSVDNNKQQQQNTAGSSSEKGKEEEKTQPNRCQWHGCQEEFSSEEQALSHIKSEHIGQGQVDACRWRSCNRIPPTTDIDEEMLKSWLVRHVLVHGPFFTSSEADKDPVTNSNANSRDIFKMTKRLRDEKSNLLTTISPPLFSGGHVPASNQSAQQQVLRLVLQGIGVVEQLQKWADRRGGDQGEKDRARVWKFGDDVVERVAFVVAQNTPVAKYGARLLAALKHHKK